MPLDSEILLRAISSTGLRKTYLDYARCALALEDAARYPRAKEYCHRVVSICKNNIRRLERFGEDTWHSEKDLCEAYGLLSRLCAGMPGEKNRQKAMKYRERMTAMEPSRFAPEIPAEGT